MRKLHSYLPMSVSFNRWMVTILFAMGSSATFASDEVKTTLAATDAGKIYFNSAEKNATYGQLYKHTAVFDSKIWGELRFPPNMTADKVPVMVLMHGSAGIQKSYYEWADFFNKMGVATFMVDSFTPRGIIDTVKDQSQLTPSASSADGLRALKLLATHPRVDARKIGVMGWSKGGTVSLATSFERVRAAVIPGDLKFALHIPLYPFCSQEAKTTSAPILLLIGASDTYVSVEGCQQVAADLKSKGSDIKYVAYEGAMHGFDTGNPTVYTSRAQILGKCNFLTDLDTLSTRIQGSDHDASSEEFRDYIKSCTHFGVTTGGNSAAASKARQEVKDFVTKNFGLGG